MTTSHPNSFSKNATGGGAVTPVSSQQFGHHRNLTVLDAPNNNTLLLENFLGSKIDIPDRAKLFANAGLVTYQTSRPLTALARKPFAGSSMTRAPTPGGPLFRQPGGK